MVRVRIEAPIRPTEDPARVQAAVRAVFPDSLLQHTGDWITATSDSIDTLLKKAGDERVMDAARGALWRGRIDDKTTRFEINKQAAAMGRVNFNEVSHPLGDIVITLEVDDLNALLDRISPPTRAEIAQRAGTAAMRAELHREEAAMEQIGTAIDEWDEDWDEEESEEDDEEEEDYDPFGRRGGSEED